MRFAATLLALVLSSIAHAQWVLQDAHTTADLRGIAALPNGAAWASGSNGTVLRTEDAGFVWQLCAIPPGAERLDFRGIQAFDSNTAIVMSSGKGDLSRLYKTIDGCQTWKLVFTNPDPEGFWDSIHFENKLSGWLLGDPVNGTFVLFHSQDAGLHWTRQHNRGLKADPIGQAAFAASNSSLLAHSGSLAFATGGPGGGEVYTQISTTICLDDCFPRDSNEDGSQNKWAHTEVPIGRANASSGIFSLVEKPYYPETSSTASVLIAVGGDYSTAEDGSRSAAVLSKTWAAATTPPHGYRSAVAYEPTHKTWITVGPNGTDLSTDDGRNWRALKPSASEPADSDKNWNALSLPYVVGPHGRIARLREDALK